MLIKRRIILLIFFITTFSFLYSQTEMYVIKSDGTKRVFELALTEITFNAVGSIVFNYSNDAPIVFSESLIREIIFEKPDTSEQISINITNGWLYINGYTTTTPQTISIFSSIGLQVLSIEQLPTSPIDLRSLPNGIFLIKIGQERYPKALKFIKK